MVKVAMLFPEDQMVETGLEAAKKAGLDVVYAKNIYTVDTVNEARAAVDAGAQIIVSRGKQAMLIRQFLKIPVVDVHLTNQEIGLLLQKTKEITKKKHPKVLIVCFENMLPDMTYMEELFGVQLEVRYVQELDETGEVMWDVEEMKPDIIIGGHDVCEAAANRGYLNLYYSTTKESVIQAMDTTVNMARMLENEIRSDEQFETMMDTSFNGVIRINNEGRIIVVNRLATRLLEKEESVLMGENIIDVLPQIDPKTIEQILAGESEQISTSLNLKGEAWMALIAPSRYDLKITGAIIAIRKYNKEDISEGGAKRMFLRGFTTGVTFAEIPAASKAMQEVIRQARIYSLSDRPILLLVPAGNDGGMLAKAIHNNSSHKEGPFVSLDLAGIPKEDQMDVLFKKTPQELEDTPEGSPFGALRKANHGTIYLKAVEALDPYVQHQIVRLLLPWRMISTDAQEIHALNVRIIVSSKKDLKLLMEQGKIEPDFYYLIGALQLRIPALKECPEDLISMFDNDLRDNMRKYNKYMQLTEGGRKCVLQLPWEGNILQLDSFTERLVLSTERRKIDEVVIRSLYDELYPKIEQTGEISSYVVYQSREGEEIREVLQKCGGNRQKAAKKLGISTTTLWRKMKKYGLE